MLVHEPSNIEACQRSHVCSKDWAGENDSFLDLFRFFNRKPLAFIAAEKSPKLGTTGFYIFAQLKTTSILY